MTPRTTVDLARLDANISRYGKLADEAGVALRAHVKGHRTPEIAARQVAAGAVGVAVHSAAEAETYLAVGVTDVAVAWPWRDPWRWTRFAQLARHCAVTVHVDHPDAVTGLGAAAVAHGVALDVRIEVDTGLHRVGVDPDAAGELATSIAETRGLRLAGVTGYVGITDPVTARDRGDLGRRQAQLLVSVAQRIRATGAPCPTVSVGGTPTLLGALGVAGVTEVCAGAYALLDGGLARLGECAPEAVAIAVTTTVTGIDGQVPRTDADTLLAGADQTWMSGVVMTRPDGTPVAADSVSVGDELRVLPGHVCPVVARQPLLHVLDSGEPVARWQALVRPDRA
ncbi:alanine racemase [Micromonospora peucetia]|uniref:alanine racemase n=1 Tax=Micromonospora peucetia TaxID=47871 RepID=UPI00224E572D|nr:alanine racemase [Micromonospora peucetia]MCX4386872.1 alanine racemase [Micromonospora peucetia]